MLILISVERIEIFWIKEGRILHYFFFCTFCQIQKSCGSLHTIPKTLKDSAKSACGMFSNFFFSLGNFHKFGFISSGYILQQCELCILITVPFPLQSDRIPCFPHVVFQKLIHVFSNSSPGYLRTAMEMDCMVHKNHSIHIRSSICQATAPNPVPTTVKCCIHAHA